MLCAANRGRGLLGIPTINFPLTIHYNESLTYGKRRRFLIVQIGSDVYIVYVNRTGITHM